jgi:hypothetical protein
MDGVCAELVGSIGDSQLDAMMCIGEEGNKVLVGIVKKARAGSATSVASVSGEGSLSTDAAMFKPDGRECLLCS